MTNSPPEFTNPQEEQWPSLPAGTLSQLALQRSRQTLLRTASLVVVCMAGVGFTIAWQVGNRTATKPVQFELSCQDVQRLLPQFVREPSFPTDLRRQILEHLKNCDHCRAEYERLQGRNTVSVFADDDGKLLSKVQRNPPGHGNSLRSHDQKDTPSFNRAQSTTINESSKLAIFNG